MSYQILGKCSKCGGLVVVPAVWFGQYAPVGVCIHCGATIKDKTPTMEME